jgi:LysR family glycine cleavage system transcriptional activator
MKRSRLPLNALRAFEAAGRHQSFKQAADELGVSDAAVSRQVRDLEALLRTKLFDRGHRQVQLTASGDQLLASVSASFDAVDVAISRLIEAPSRMVVSVSVEPTFANVFLVPRLARFADCCPEVEVQIDSSANLVDPSAGGPRLAIRHSRTKSSWPRSQARRLIDNMLTPMLAASAGSALLQSPRELTKFRLLRDEDGQAWIGWLESAGVTEPALWGPVYSDAALAVRSAELGHGAALGNRILAAELLQKGSLYAPFDIELSNGAYWLVVSDFRHLTTEETLFCQWLVNELDQSAAAVRQGSGRSGLKLLKALVV